MPTLVTLGADGKEHHRTVGFLPPEELIPSLLLGRAKADFDMDDFASAIQTLEQILAGHPKSSSAPEAILLLGVSRCKSTHDPKPLKGAYEKLQAEYPDSEWTKRTYPYRLLQHSSAPVARRRISPAASPAPKPGLAPRLEPHNSHFNDSRKRIYVLAHQGWMHPIGEKNIQRKGQPDASHCSSFAPFYRIRDPRNDPHCQ